MERYARVILSFFENVDENNFNSIKNDLILIEMCIKEEENKLIKKIKKMNKKDKLIMNKISYAKKNVKPINYIRGDCKIYKYLVQSQTDGSKLFYEEYFSKNKPVENSYWYEIKYGHYDGLLKRIDGTFVYKKKGCDVLVIKDNVVISNYLSIKINVSEVNELISSSRQTMNFTVVDDKIFPFKYCYEKINNISITLKIINNVKIVVITSSVFDNLYFFPTDTIKFIYAKNSDNLVTIRRKNNATDAKDYYLNHPPKTKFIHYLDTFFRFN